MVDAIVKHKRVNSMKLTKTPFLNKEDFSNKKWLPK